MNIVKDDTARKRALDALRLAPNGLSKSELYRQVGGNSGAFRRLIMSMEGRGEIVISTEHRSSCGLTRVVTIADEPRAA